MRSDWTLPICNGKERLKRNGKKFILHRNQKRFYIELFQLLQIKVIPSLIHFLGTGTTAVVAKKLGRRYFGIEKDKNYFKAADERIKKAKGN